MKIAIVFFSILFLQFSCTEPIVEDEPNRNWSKEQSIAMNSNFSTEEIKEIDNYLKRHHDWKMTKTGTGLYYMIYRDSLVGDTVKGGDFVTINFEVSLLNGDICYTSKEKGPEKLQVEKSDIESGLHEGLKYMTRGDKAKFILPSHIAHGLIGDTEKIPPLSPVIYDIELLKIEQ